MTLLFSMNLGFGWSGIIGPAFKPAWAANCNQYIGASLQQPVTK